MTSPPNLDELNGAFTVSEVAERTGRSLHAVRDDIYNGKLPAWKLGGRWRVLPADLEAFVASLVTPSRGAR